MKLTKKQINFLGNVVKGRWVLNTNGEVDVDGVVDMRSMYLKEIPVKFGSVSGGNFYCSFNKLTSLIGSPTSIEGGNFECHSNQLTSLEGSPKSIVGGGFGCADNKLTSLEGCPTSIEGGILHCSFNQLTDYFKNIKEEDFPHWDKLKWDYILSEYPFLINVTKKYVIDWEKYLRVYPQTKEYLITEPKEDDVKLHSTSNSIKIENGNLTLNINNSEINIKITDKTNFNLTF